MTERSSSHAAFTIERLYPVAPARVFAAWADGKAKERWFFGPSPWQLLERQFDFRIGGHERASGRWPTGMVSTFDAWYHDIVPDARIVYAYDMHLDERHISVSLATVTFAAEGAGTKMVFTEQAVFLDGYDDAGSRERGTGILLDQFGEALRALS